MQVDKILQKSSAGSVISYPEGSLILVDKPLTWTSFDVVNKIRFAIRHAYGIRKCKVGHAGTLDPLASGLLLICTGPYTKQIEILQNRPKIYTGIIKLGATTPTYDAESAPENFFPVPLIDESMLSTMINHFSGEFEQIPPVYSAIKMKGQKSYQLARRGEEVELKPRKVTIYSMEASLKTPDEIYFRVHCSKGTYIRSLAHDIGRYFTCGAYLLSLRRESVGEFSVDDSLVLDEVISCIQKSRPDPG